MNKSTERLLMLLNTLSCLYGYSNCTVLLWHVKGEVPHNVSHLLSLWKGSDVSLLPPCRSFRKMHTNYVTYLSLVEKTAYCQHKWTNRQYDMIKLIWLILINLRKVCLLLDQTERRICQNSVQLENLHIHSLKLPKTLKRSRLGWGSSKKSIL